MESGRKNDRPQLAAAFAQARAEKAVITVAKIDQLATDAGFVLKLANEAGKNGMGGFVFCDLPDIEATTSAGRMVLTMMASVAEFEARRIASAPVKPCPQPRPGTSSSVVTGRVRQRSQPPAGARPWPKPNR